MSFIIHANRETKKLDSIENNMLYLSLLLLEDPLRHTADEVKANERSVSVLLLFNYTQQKALLYFNIISHYQFLVPSEMTVTHIGSFYDWATEHTPFLFLWCRTLLVAALHSVAPLSLQIHVWDASRVYFDLKNLLLSAALYYSTADMHMQSGL